MLLKYCLTLLPFFLLFIKSFDYISVECNMYCLKKKTKKIIISFHRILTCPLFDYIDFWQKFNRKEDEMGKLPDLKKSTLKFDLLNSWLTFFFILNLFGFYLPGIQQNKNNLKVKKILFSLSRWKNILFFICKAICLSSIGI